MDYTYEKFIADVTVEANNIKIYATEEEKSRLNSKLLEPSSSKQCIYGQMTGSCFNDRAIELISKCTPRYFTDGAMPYLFNGAAKFESIAQHVCDEPVEDFRKRRTTLYCEVRYFSAIETFISMRSSTSNENIIKYIKGEIETLEL